MSSYTVRIGTMDLGTTETTWIAAALIADARDMQRWASHYGDAISLTVDGQAIDTTDHNELARVGIEIA